MNISQGRRYLAAILLICGTTSLWAQPQWVASWTAAQQLVEPQNRILQAERSDLTLRQVVHLSAGGDRLRVVISNRFGTAPLRFNGVHAARAQSPSSSAIVAGTDTVLEFSGRPDVTVPAGADYVSDPVAFHTAALSDLAITLHLAAVPEDQTGHPGSRATTYLAHGDVVSARNIGDAVKVEHWYFVAEVDVTAPRGADAIVALGDSITDGHAATTNGNNRWPDVLARRLQATAATRDISVLNEGIGGNRLLHDGLGPNALARFDHDVLTPAGVRYVIVLEGINDLGTLTREHEVPPAEHEQLVRRIIAAYQQIVTRAHTHGIAVFGATILPFLGSDYYHPDAETEADREKINAWIREPGHFDGFIDFDRLMRDPKQPGHLLPKFDSGDHLHPGPAGYQAMGDAVPLTLFHAEIAPRAGVHLRRPK